MEVNLKSTDKVVELVVGGLAVPARIWEGMTAGGVPCHAYVMRIACPLDADSSEFDRELKQHEPPSAAIASIPLRMILSLLLMLTIAGDSKADTVGLVVGVQAADRENAGRIQRAIERGEDVELPRGEAFVAGPIRLPAKVGVARIRGRSGRNYFLASDAYGPNIGGLWSCLTSTNGQPIFVLDGAGGTFESFEMRGRPWLTDQGPVGKRPESLVEVSSMLIPSTGRHVFWNVAGTEAQSVLRFPRRVGAENHADNGVWYNGTFINVDRVVWSQNQQAMVWAFYSCIVDAHEFEGQTIVDDCERGGCHYWFGLSLNHPRVVLLRVGDFSPNNNYFMFRDFRWDTPQIRGAYIALFEYAGPQWQAVRGKGITWNAGYSGLIAAKPWLSDPATGGDPGPGQYDELKLLRAPQSLETTGLDVGGVIGMPVGKTIDQLIEQTFAK